MLVWTCRVAALATAIYRHICGISRVVIPTAAVITLIETGVIPGDTVEAEGAIIVVTVVAAVAETGTVRLITPALIAGN